MIPFRKQRLATSVTNRIFNIYDGLPPRAVAPGAPAAPEPLAEGAKLDATIAAPKPPVDADPQTADAIGMAPLLR